MKNYFYASVLLVFATLGLAACGSSGGGSNNNDTVAAASSCTPGQYWSASYGCLNQGICAGQIGTAQYGTTCVPAQPVTCSGGYNNGYNSPYGNTGYNNGYNNGGGYPYGGSGYGTCSVNTYPGGYPGSYPGGYPTTGGVGQTITLAGWGPVQLGAGGCPSTLAYSVTQQYGPVCIDPNMPSRYWVLQNMVAGNYYGGAYYGGGYVGGGYPYNYYGNSGFHGGVTIGF